MTQQDIKIGSIFQDKDGNEYIIIEKYADGVYNAKVFTKSGRLSGIVSFFDSDAKYYNQIK